MSRWEYLMVPQISQTQANRLGAEGWELVTVMPVELVFIWVFKRPKSEDQT